MNIDKLEALARNVSKQDCDNWRADPGKKNAVLADGESAVGTYRLLVAIAPDVAEYIAAANPVVVLGLIAEIRRLEDLVRAADHDRWNATTY